MNIRSAIKLSRVRDFISRTVFISTLLIYSTKSSLLASGVKDNVEKPEATLLQFFADTFNPKSVNVSFECRRDSALYHDALKNYVPWALQMYDASTKIPSGFITGNTKQLGNYDECLRVKSNHSFVGKACSAKVQFVIADRTNVTENDNNMQGVESLLLNIALASGLKNWTSGTSAPYEWLWCVPSSCSPRDIAETAQIGLDALKRPQRVDFTLQVGNKSCHTQESDWPALDLADKLYIFLLTLFGSAVVISTVYDLVRQSSLERPDPKDTKYALLCFFSAYTNGKNLNAKRGPGSFDCLDGLRFLSICWIIYGHTYYLKIVGVNLDLLSVATLHERWDSFLLLNANIATDTFLLLSGLLLANSELTKKEKYFDRYRFNVWKLYVRRYLRLTPAYAIMIGFYATLFYKIGSGPYWDTWVESNRNYCRKNWWTNLLYVNNYVDVPNMCMSQSWYLAVDMQLVWISPIFLYPMLGKGKRNQLIFLTVLATVFLASVLAPLLITYSNGLTGTMLYYKNQADLGEVYLQIYTRVYTRAGPYLLGLGLGYLLRKIKPSNTSIPKCVIFVGWTLATVAGLAVVFGPRGMYFPDHEYDNVEAGFYAGFHRPVFAVAVSWIIVACVFGCAGPVGALLSWSFWVPLSKLTYSLYLTHYIIILYNAGNARTPEHLTTFGVVQSFVSNLAMSLALSVIVSLTFEFPFNRLTNHWFSSSRGFSSTSAKRAISPFETSESTLEIYRPTEEPPYTVSRTYDDLMDRYAKVGTDNCQGPEWSPPTTSGNYNRNSIVVESKENEAFDPINSKARKPLGNVEFKMIQSTDIVLTVRRLFLEVLPEISYSS